MIWNSIKTRILMVKQKANGGKKNVKIYNERKGIKVND